MERNTMLAQLLQVIVSFGNNTCIFLFSPNAESMESIYCTEMNDDAFAKDKSTHTKIRE